jgi:formylglycine-generating enzyme required for sulfatase activity
MKRTTRTWLLLGTLLGLGGAACQPEKGSDTQTCLKLEEVMTTEVTPAGVRSVFRIWSCDGAPMADLRTNEVSVLLDGHALQSEGDVAPILTQEVEFQLNTMLLLDLSDSIVDNNNLLPMLEAARTAAHALVAQGHRVAVYQFAGPPYFGPVQGFTTDIAALDAALDGLETTAGFGTTDLYGSIEKAAQILATERPADALSSETLVLFTDGTDEAMVSDAQTAQSVIGAADLNVFTVGLGGDVNQAELTAFGVSGFEWAADAGDLAAAFAAVTQKISALAHSYYLMAVCSPRVGGERDMTIVVRRGETTGRLTVTYDADGFDIVGCDPQVVAFPCTNRECGAVEGFSCGECGTTALCSDEGQCVEACVGDIECGYVDGADCGDCSDRGDGWVCDANTCVDACAEAACGTVLGVDCGGCSDLGENYACSDNACVDACAEAECGTVLGVDCGDCSDLGENYACSDNACVDACAEAECGTVLGVECGECPLNLVCGSDNTCGPSELEGADWIAIPGAAATVGCLASLDPSCADDEGRHEVSVSSFWIMSTEVTAGMYAACVDDGWCNASHVTDSDASCTYGVAGDETHPLNCVDWAGMQEFCEYAGGDLPTEAQWELAVRGTHDGAADTYWIYPWGNSPEPSCTLAVMNDGGAGCGLAGTDAVGTKPSTGLGLFNMACNVSEWTRDLYGAELGGCASYPCADPDGPAAGDERVVRGGNWGDFYASAFRTAARDSRDPASPSPSVGGRCVVAM